MTTNSLNQPLLIRDSASGRILGGSEVKSFSLRTSHQTGCFYEEAGNPISTIGLPVVISGDTGGSEIRCVTIIGGVTFLDGTTSTSLWAKDFDDFGVTTLYFLKPNTAHSNCRRFTVWKDGACIAR